MGCGFWHLVVTLPAHCEHDRTVRRRRCEISGFENETATGAPVDIRIGPTIFAMFGV